MTSTAVRGAALHAAFARHARHAPDSVALAIGKRDYTYGEVDELAARWATALRIGGRTPARVGVYAYRNETSYVGVLAALYSGAAFVPLNRTLPVERARLILELAQLDAVIVDADSEQHFADAVRGLDTVPPVILRPASDAPYPAADPALPELGADSARPAYILFTSGTTGRPKGVPISHANAVHFMTVNQQRYGLTPDDRLTQTFDQTFDLSVFDLFMAWEAGAAVVSMRPIHLVAPYRFVAENRITVWFSVPSVIALLLKAGTLEPASMPSLRWSLFCGEALPRAAAEAWQAAAPNSTVENLYGPTELTIACSVHRWDPDTSPAACVHDLVPIGTPYPGMTAVLRAEDGTLVDGVGEGELCLAGPQRFDGYLFATETPNLIDLPAPDGGVECFYRTGDRVRRLADGGLAYLGRTDHQIKIGGHRVELGEIEAVLAQSPGVVAATAVGWPIDGSGAIQGVVAFVLGPRPDPDVVLKTAQSTLPDYMVPRRVVPVEQFPLNANGKTDRAALTRQLAEDGS